MPRQDNTTAITAVQLQEWETITPETCPALVGVHLPEDDATRRLCAALQAQSGLTLWERRDGVEIAAQAHVGRIQVGALQVTIFPKLQGMPLWQLFRYTYGLQDLRRATETRFATAVLPFQDFLIVLLLDEVETLLACGLYRQYRRQPMTLTVPRGQLDLPALTRQGGVREAALPCLVHDRVEDSPVNQAVLAGLRLAITATTDRELRRGAHRLIMRLTDQVATVPLTTAFWRQVQRARSRLTTAYDSTLTLIELLWAGHGLSWEAAAGTLVTEGALFDMNRFYQAMLARFLREHLPAYTVETEPRVTSLFTYAPERNPRQRSAPVVRPDFRIRRGLQVLALLDAKYRDLWELELPREMLYQLSLYAVSDAQVQEATILYPTMTPTASEASLQVRPWDGRQCAHIHLRPVHLPTLASLVTPSRTAVQQRACHDYARYLAFGR